MIDRSRVLQYVVDKYGTQPEYLWKKTPNNAILRHAGNRKWYGVLMMLSKSTLGLKGEGRAEIMNVKCRPELSGVLRQTPGYFPGYHMNKEHWLTILLDGTVAAKEVYALIDHSFDLTK
ncbi:MAG: hypothetical protein MESAZ_00326 [Saezia sanguinis]